MMILKKKKLIKKKNKTLEIRFFLSLIKNNLILKVKHIFLSKFVKRVLYKVNQDPKTIDF